jgi:hypothetical protein
MQIKRVFDVIGPGGFAPNGWNYNYTEDYWDNNFTVTHEFIEKFNKKYVQVPVYDCNLNLPEDNVKNIHISDVKYDDDSDLLFDNHESGLFLYTIHPYGSIDTCTGDNLNYHENTHCFDFISEKVKNYLRKSKNLFLVLDYSSEGDIRKTLFQNLHKKCKELNIPPSKVLVISSAMNTRDIYQSYLNQTPQEEQFYTAYYCWSLVSKMKETRHLLYDNEIFEFNGHSNRNSLMSIDELKSLKNRNKKCLILNRRVAPHRVILLSLLESQKLLKDVSYSIDLSLWNHNDLGLDIANGVDYDDNPYIIDKVVKSKMLYGFFKLKKIGKSVVDYENVGSVWGFGFENKENYKNTYFSIITETIFYEHGHYISEKTFKGIQHLHPFIIIGKPGIIKWLKEKGFKTFSEFWDESYDEIYDNSERIIKIFNIVKSLINKTNEEWDEMYEKLYPILEYNRNRLLEYTEEIVGDIYIQNLNKLLENETNKENYFLL